MQHRDWSQRNAAVWIWTWFIFGPVTLGLSAVVGAVVAVFWCRRKDAPLAAAHARAALRLLAWGSVWILVPLALVFHVYGMSWPLAGAAAYSLLATMLVWFRGAITAAKAYDFRGPEE